MAANRQTAIERANAMFKDRRRLGGNLGLRVELLLFRFQRRLLEEWNHFIEHREIAGRVDVKRSDKWQPQEIVGATRAYAAARRRMPPVLHVAFFELMTTGEQNLLASNSRTAVDKRHYVLQLIAKTECAA